MKILCTADWHFRYDVPKCRVDDFFETQKKTINEIFDIYIKEECNYMVVAGDIFDTGRPDHAQELESFLIQKFSIIESIIVPGNHDLLYKRMENTYKSSIGVLLPLTFNDPAFNLVGYGEQIKNTEHSILVTHKFCEETSLPPWMDDGVTAKHLLDEYDYHIIVIGDNHRGFVYQGKDGRLVINPGAITRQESDKKDYKPFIVLVDTETLIYEKIYLKSDINPNYITDSHITMVKQRENRISSFVEHLKTASGKNLSFDKMVDEYIIKNKVSDLVETKIKQAMEK